MNDPVHVGFLYSALLCPVVVWGLFQARKERAARGAPPAKGHPLVVALPFIVMTAAFGCASLGKWSPSALPDVAALCAFSGDVEPQLEALAVQNGVPLWVIQDAFKAACSETAKGDAQNARHAGLVAARASAHAVRAMRLGDGRDAGAQ